MSKFSCSMNTNSIMKTNKQRLFILTTLMSLKYME